MVTWRTALPSDESARLLLDQYFTARALGFPAGPDAYRRTVPVDGEFSPPVGVFVLVEGENLSGEPADVGCGGVRRVSDGPHGPRFEVKHLWVQPHTRRLGYGRSLMDELTRRARELGGAELVRRVGHWQSSQSKIDSQFAILYTRVGVYKIRVSFTQPTHVDRSICWTHSARHGTINIKTDAYFLWQSCNDLITLLFPSFSFKSFGFHISISID
jgi:GNAT superfamily N-acetyltransferase